MRCHNTSEKESIKPTISTETYTRDMDDAVLETPPTDALWMIHNSTEENEDNDAKTVPEDKEKEDNLPMILYRRRRRTRYWTTPFTTPLI